jgi:CHAT domain-containing protein
VQVFESVRTQLSAPEEAHVAFLTDKASVYTDLVDALLLRGRPADRAEALQVLERSRSRLVVERLTQAAPWLESERLAQLRRELSEAYYQLNGFPDETRRFGGMGGMHETVRARESAYRVALREAELEQKVSPVASEAFSGEALPLVPDEIAIAYYCTTDACHAFVLRPGRPVAFVEQLCTRRTLAQAARRLRFHLTRPSTQYTEAQSILQELGELLIRPLERYSREAQRLIVVPHGEVIGLPIAALHERHTVTLAPNLALFTAARLRPPVKRGNALAMGLSSPDIPAATDEARRVAAGFDPATLCLGEQATREAFFAHAPQSHVIHLATHALFRADNPLFSGLQLADGWLLAHELHALRLNAEVVTLSACQTGAATVSAEGDTFGLVRSFLTAGARSVVASLWNADDSVTRCLMERFYEEVCKETVSVADALRVAQHETRKRFPHPYYWAAFQVFGG